MVIYSDKTGLKYDTVEACVKAEKEYDEKVAAEKAAKEKALAEAKAKEEKVTADRKAAADKVEAARKAMVEATKAYHEELARFCEKFGAYHVSFRTKPNERWADIFDDIFSPFWF